MILVVGCGFVGEAIAKSLEENRKTTIVRIDPKYNDNKISDYPDALGAIVAVPTPTVDGVCDDSAIKQVLSELGDMRVLLKCTVPPDMLETYPDNVTYNPEFLRQKTAVEDFYNQTTFILGTNSTLDAYFWEQQFSYLPHVNFVKTDRRTASMVKYMHNCWLATKVAFFHEIMYNTDKNYNHEDMVSILSTFENVGPSHMNLNDEGKLGFGGHCFPKDTEAFLDYTNSDILRQVIETNKKLGDL